MADEITISSTTDAIEAVQAAAGIKPGEGQAPANQVAGQAVARVVKSPTAPPPVAAEPAVVPVAEPVKPIEVPVAAAPVAQTDDEQEEAAAEAEVVKPDPLKQAAGKKRGRLQERIDTLVAANRKTEAEKAAINAEVAALRKRMEEIIVHPPQPQAPPVVATPAEPETAPLVTEFDSYDAWVAANTAFQIRQAVTATEERFKQQLEAVQQANKVARLQEQQTQHAATAVQTYVERLPDAQARYADWNEVVTEDVPVSPYMAEAIVESEVGPDVAYYLGKNPDVRQELFGLGQTAAAAKLFGKIEERVATQVASAREAKTKPATETPAAPVAPTLAAPAPVVPVTKAPDPIEPVGTSRSTTEVPIDELPYQEYKAARVRQQRARLGLGA